MAMVTLSMTAMTIWTLPTAVVAWTTVAKLGDLAQSVKATSVIQSSPLFTWTPSKRIELGDGSLALRSIWGSDQFMPLTLILMRHAKSNWGVPSQDDFDRALNGRGKESALTMADWLIQHGHLPETVLVSGARRTVETWERMAHKFPETADMQSAPALYLAEPTVILGVIRSQTARTLMVIGHNPGMALLAASLVTVPPKHEKFAQYPTAATSVLGFKSENWSEIGPGLGRVIDFAVPRDLIQ